MLKSRMLQLRLHQLMLHRLVREQTESPDKTGDCTPCSQCTAHGVHQHFHNRKAKPSVSVSMIEALACTYGTKSNSLSSVRHDPFYPRHTLNQSGFRDSVLSIRKNTRICDIRNHKCNAPVHLIALDMRFDTTRTSRPSSPITLRGTSSLI